MSLLTCAVAMLCGALVLLTSDEFPSAFTLIAAAFMLTVATMWQRFSLGAAAWFCAGFLLAALHTHQYTRMRWSDTTGQRALVSATVDTVPSITAGAWQFDAIAHIEMPDVQRGVRRIRIVSRDASVRPHAGERWQLLLTLQPPRASLNPGAVDYERHLFQDRVHALGVVVASRLNRRLDSGHRPLTFLREQIARRIDAHVADRDAAALIAALAVGVTDAMSREQWRVFNTTGTTHLVAISGLHVTLFAIVAMACARAIWWLGIWHVVRWPRETFAAVFGLCAATAYAALAGFSVPTQRTLIMLAAWIVVRCLARATAPTAAIAIAVLAVLTLDPFSVLAPGFWLSFGAMAAILFITQPRVLPRRKLHEAFAVQAAASLALVPLTLGWFGSVSLVAPAVNVLAIPFFSWILVPVVLLAVVVDPLLEAAGRLYELSWPWLSAAADVPFALAYANPPVWWYPVAMIAIVIGLMPWPWRLRAGMLVIVFSLANLSSVGRLSDGAVRITLLDVGRGTAIVVQSRHHVLLYGTADTYGSRGGKVDSIVVPFLRSRNIHAIDLLIADGGSTGVTALVAAMPVRRIAPTAPSGGWIWDGVIFGGPDLEIAAAGAHARVRREGVILSHSGTIRLLRPTADTGAIEVSLDPGMPPSTPREERRARPALWRP